MPNNLPLAVEIADATSAEPVASQGAALAKARDLAARHPDAEADAEQVARILQDLSRDPPA